MKDIKAKDIKAKDIKEMTINEINNLRIEDFKNKKSAVAGTTTECSISTPQEVQKKIISEILTIDGKHITN